MDKLNYQFLLSLCIVIAGYGARRAGLVTAKDGEALSRVVLNITLPALILHTFGSFTVDRALAILPVVCVVFSLAMAAISFRSFRMEPPEKRGLLTISAMGFNIGLFAFPLVEGVWGAEGLRYIAMFDMGNALIVFFVSYLAGSFLSPVARPAGTGEVIRQILTFLPFMSYVLSLGMNVTGLRFHPFAADMLATVSRANMALVLLLLGIFLDFSLSRSEWGRIARVAGLRYGLGLAAGAALYFLLPIGALQRGIIAIALVLPVGMSTIPYAVEFGYDAKLAGMLVNTTNIISFALMWLMSMVIINLK